MLKPVHCLCFLASKYYKWYVLISRGKSFRFCRTKRINACHSEEASAGVLWAMMLSFIHWLLTEARRRSNYSRRLPPNLPCVARLEKRECPKASAVDMSISLQTAWGDKLVKPYTCSSRRSGKLNPFTAGTGKMSGLKDARTRCKRYIFCAGGRGVKSVRQEGE